MPRTPAPAVQHALKALLDRIFADPAASFGYAMKELLFAKTVRITLEKSGAPLVVWLRAATDDDRFYKRTARFKIGYSGVAPDAHAYRLIDVLHGHLAQWEQTLSDGDVPQLFGPEPSTPVGVASEPLDPVAASLLAPATFTPIYDEWLIEREKRITSRFEQAQTGPRKILLVNATLGLQLYPSITDYFAQLQRIRPAITVSCASYFAHIEEFSVHVVRKGLHVLPVAEVMTWSVEAYNRFDVVVLIGPSDILARLMTLEGLTARLVLLDLAFYHQLLDQHEERFRKNQCLVADMAAQRNRVVCYSCQPAVKARKDLGVLCSLPLIEWRWFNYIPIGFAYSAYYRSDQHPFDVALLGSAKRDYSQIDPERFRGLRFLFLGSLEGAPVVERLRETLDITVVSKVDPDVYARLLALCRCVLIPLLPDVTNVLMSVLDSVASGKGMVIPWHAGLSRLARESLPAMLYVPSTPDDLARQVHGFVHDTARQHEIEARSLAFAQEHLDIYNILGVILDEQILG
jgi:hypothetical protein